MLNIVADSLPLSIPLVLGPSSQASCQNQVPTDLSQHRKTQIIATLGPVCETPEAVADLIESGVSVFRLNFSHATHAWHTRMASVVRREAERLGKAVALMQDLCGPKIRISRVNGVPDTRRGELLWITTDLRTESSQDDIDWRYDLTTSYEHILDDVSPGDALVIDDGRVELQVKELTRDRMLVEVIRGGKIEAGKGLNLPGVQLSTPSMTDKDWIDIAWGIAHRVDFVALSFVRTVDDVRQVREYLQRSGCSARIIAKIERPEALACIDSIVEAADAVMVARGDLGLETELARVPIVQKRLIQLCRQLARPVITATQLLDSMVHSAVPTRAEVSDVANAVLDACDALMLSNETAVGKYGIPAVRYLDQIARSAEGSRVQHDIDWTWIDGESDLGSVTAAAAQLAISTSAKYVVVHTESGYSARLLSRYRLPMPVIAVTRDPQTAASLRLSYGIWPICLPPDQNAESRDASSVLADLDEMIQCQHWGAPGDRLVVVSAFDRTFGRLDTLHIHHVRPTQA